MVSSASSTTAHCFGVRLLASSRTMWSWGAQILLSAQGQDPAAPTPAKPARGSGGVLAAVALAPTLEQRAPQHPQPSPSAR